MGFFYRSVWILVYAYTTVQAATNSSTALLSLGRQLNVKFWSGSLDPCDTNWQGISCNSAGQVVSINLNSNSLTADISNLSFSDLSNLTSLDLGNNNLYGYIPLSILSLHDLVNLSLGTNSLSGSIPADVGNLTSLQNLYLDTNQLNGTIPSSIGQLKKLKTLYLHSNILSGIIPDQIGELSSLTNLRLYGNRLSGRVPSSLANLTKLSDLRLPNNYFSGNLSFLEEIQSLEYIFLHRNNFTGTLPDLSKLTSLLQLSLGFNQLNGSIPISYGNLNLNLLFLSHNTLTGTIPDSFSSYTSMHLLDVSHNALNGSANTLTSLAKSINNLQLSYGFNYFNDSGSTSDSAAFQCKGEAVNSCVPTITGDRTGFAIDAGNTASTTYENVNFEADASVNFYTGLKKGGDGNWALELGGQDGDVGKATDTTGELPLIYQTYRWSSDYIGYHGIKLQSGSYNVSLHFAECSYLSVGARLFDVYVQGNLVKEKLDVFSEVGGNSPYVFSITATVQNGTLLIELWGDGTDRYTTSNQEKAGPMVSAISVTPLYNTSHKNNAAIIGGVIGGFLALLILGFALFWLICRTSKKQKLDTVPLVPDSTPVPPLSNVGPFIYTLQELHEATDGFSENQKLGTGGFGEVYKGVLRDGSVVAIKRLLEKIRSSGEDFRQEISILCMLQHKNLVGIRGYCLTSDMELLVCDYMPNGSLDKHLFPKNEDTPVLNWQMRRDIAIGSACGLAYLHEESNVRVVHCDVKPGNILLDADFNARLCDFGLARLYKDDKSHMTATKFRGTAGYVSPEYAMHLRLSDKLDVYSFGVVLLELLSGRRPMDESRPTEEVILTNWARDLAYKDPSNMCGIMDKRLEEFNKDEAIAMANIAMLCIQDSALVRPKMRDVWLMLKGSIPIPQLPPQLVSNWESTRALELSYASKSDTTDASS